MWLLEEVNSDEGVRTAIGVAAGVRSSVGCWCEDDRKVAGSSRRRDGERVEDGRNGFDGEVCGVWRGCYNGEDNGRRGTILLIFLFFLFFSRERICQWSYEWNPPPKSTMDCPFSYIF